MKPHSTNRCPRGGRQTRNGFTLVELLLVLALLVVIAGFTAAAMEGSLLQSKLRQGTEDVRTTWSDARVQAISGGQRLAFTCVVGGRDYRISSCSDQYVPTDPAAETQVSNVPKVAGTTGQLPEGVVFRSIQAAPSKVMAQQSMLPAKDDGQWSAPVVFNPDGTSYDAVLVLEGESGRQVRLALRGLTCTAESGDVKSPRELR